MNHNWHQLPAEEAMRLLKADRKEGLSSGEVAARQKEHGFNEMTAGKSRNPFFQFLSQFRLQVDESALTGDAVTVEKNSDPLAKETVLADRTCMAYGGSLVTYGQARAIVVAIGDATENGRITRMMQEAPDLDTVLTRKIKTFSHYLLYAISALAVVTFLVRRVRQIPRVEIFMTTVALAVGMIPEGLPARESGLE